MELDEIARLHAAVQNGASWNGLLQKGRFTRAQWLTAERAWLDALIAEVGAGRSELGDRYMQVLHDKPAPQAAKTHIAASAVTPSVRAMPEPPMPTAAPAPHYMPAAMRSFADVDHTQASIGSPAGAPLPFVATKGAPAASVAKESMNWIPKGMRAAQDIGGTMAIADVPTSPALPFEKKNDIAASSRTAFPTKTTTKTPAAFEIPAAMRGMVDVDGTQIASEIAANEKVLPFDPTAQPKLATKTESASWMPKGMMGMTDVDATTVMSTVASGPPMPFKDLDKPKKITASTPAPASATALPAQPIGRDTNGPVLPLEHYAALCVELALYPTHRAEVLRRYSIDETQRLQLDAFWSPRVKIDPSLRVAWDTYYVAHWTRLRGTQNQR